MSRLFDRIEKGELALGTAVLGGPHLMPVVAEAGFDWVRPDMMVTSIDWGELERIVRAAQAVGLTTVVRIPCNPWVLGEEDLAWVVDAYRAYNIGVDMVQLQVASVKQTQVLLDLAKNTHHFGMGEFPTSLDGKAEQARQVGRYVHALPGIESLTAVRDLDKILSLDSLRFIHLSISDLARVLGHTRFDSEHPDVWAVIDKIARVAKERKLVVSANTGFAYDTYEKNVARVKRLYDRGVRMVMLQAQEFLLYITMRDLARGIRQEVS